MVDDVNEAAPSALHGASSPSPPAEYEPAHAAELGEEADKMLRRTWGSGQFLDPDLEMAYKRWHAQMLRPRFGVINFAAFVCFTVGALPALINEHSLKNMIISVHPEVEPLIVVCTISARLMPLIISILVFLPRTRGALTARTYQPIAFGSFFIPMLIEVTPFLVLLTPVMHGKRYDEHVNEARDQQWGTVPSLGGNSSCLFYSLDTVHPL